MVGNGSSALDDRVEREEDLIGSALGRIQDAQLSCRRPCADLVDVPSQMMSDRVPAISDVLHGRSYLDPVVDREIHDEILDRRPS